MDELMKVCQQLKDGASNGTNVVAPPSVFSGWQLPTLPSVPMLMSFLFRNNNQPVIPNPFLANLAVPSIQDFFPFPSLPPTQTLPESNVGPMRQNKKKKEVEHVFKVPKMKEKSKVHPAILKVQRIKEEIREECMKKRVLLNTLLPMVGAPHLKIVQENIRRMMEKNDENQRMWMEQCNQAADAISRSKWTQRDQEVVFRHLLHCHISNPKELHSTVKRIAELYNKHEGTIFRYFRQFLIDSPPSEGAPAPSAQNNGTTLVNDKDSKVLLNNSKLPKPVADIFDEIGSSQVPTKPATISQHEVRCLLRPIQRAYPDNAAEALKTSCQIFANADIEKPDVVSP